MKKILFYLSLVFLLLIIFGCTTFQSTLCGDGNCGPGEIDNCPSDCGVSDNTGNLPPVNTKTQQSNIDCGILKNSVILDKDLVSQGTCFTIASDNVVIDCNGHSITGTHIAVQPYCSGPSYCSQWNHNSRDCRNDEFCRWVTFPDPNPTTSYGIYSDDFNKVEIKNCRITNFTSGIYLKNTQNSKINYNTLQYNTDQGIKLTNPRQSTISRNTVSNNGFRFFFDWSNLTFPLPIDFDGIYINYKLEPRREAQTYYSNANNIISNNYLSENSLSGVVIDEGINNNIIENNIAYLNYENRGNGITVYSDYNEIRNNNATFNMIAGIAAETSSHNKIHDNLVYHNNYTGILIEDSSHYNEIYSNRIEYNGCEGVYINRRIMGGEDTASTYNRVHDNQIINNTLDNEQAGGGCILHFGILVDISPYTYVYNNYIKDNGVGISPDLSDNQYYFNNTLYNVSEGIYFQGGGKNSIIYSNRIHSAGMCVYVSPSSNITISDNNMFCGEGLGTAVIAEQVNGISLIRNKITCIERFWGIYIGSHSGDFNFEDNVILCGHIPINIGTISNNNTYHFINSTYNQNIQEIFPYQCSTPTASREWYLKVFVKDKTGKPIDNAIIQLRSSTGVIYNSRTDVNGTTPQLTLPEYQRKLNWTENCTDYNIITNWFSPYTMTVSKPGYRTSTMQLELDRSKDVTITLEKENPSESNTN